MEIESIRVLAEASGFEISQHRTVAGAEPVFDPPPSTLNLRVRDLLRQHFPKGLYSHQALAIRKILDGQDVCLATSTASGKSHAFMSVAAHRLLEDPYAKVLAMYPARALVRDQMDKWSSFLKPLGLPVSQIDGSVEVAERMALLRDGRVLVMTPDVVHAWLMSRVGEAEVSEFLAHLSMVVLDEAHAYDGVFGTNMAYLLRRLAVASNAFQMFASTATVGNPGQFLNEIAGREFTTIGASSDGAERAEKEIIVLSEHRNKSFESTITLLEALTHASARRFLAFGDSRRAVERITSAVIRSKEPKRDEEEPLEVGVRGAVLPYRAGYEAEDRNAIQSALTTGTLVGVVSTSALELGIDIGEIDTVVLLNPPPSVKSFWQRIGRAGRSGQATCIVLDIGETITAFPNGIDHYINGEPEPNRLYLDNKYLQYANVLCAAQENASQGRDVLAKFSSVPDLFRSLLVNEIEPSEVVPAELYELKQRAQGGPHYEFPLRTGVEKEFQIIGPMERKLGNVSFSQLMREAHPGAIYYYMARPYRVTQYRHRDGVVRVKQEKRWTTNPISKTTVFPKFGSGTLSMFTSDSEFVAEVEVQVSERLLGFTETRGGAHPERNLFGPGSPFLQRPLDRFFQSTGVCWRFQNARWMSEDVASMLHATFCLEFGIQERDLGIGRFYARVSPVGPSPSQGFCIYDGAHGSLRLTEPLARSLPRIARLGAQLALRRDQGAVADALRGIAESCDGMDLSPVEDRPTVGIGDLADWVEVVADGEQAMLINTGGTREVTVLRYRYTPQGLRYQLQSDRKGMTWHVPKETVEPLAGRTRMVWVNLMTGETQPSFERKEVWTPWEGIRVADIIEEFVLLNSGSPFMPTGAERIRPLLEDSRLQSIDPVVAVDEDGCLAVEARLATDKQLFVEIEPSGEVRADIYNETSHILGPLPLSTISELLEYLGLSEA